MLFRLIVIVILAVGVAGMVIAINKLTGGRVPKWALPAAIAGVVIGYSVFDEYNWYDRKSSALGDNWVIVATSSPRTFWKPWTYIKPPVSSFLAVNLERQQPLEGQSGYYTNFLHAANYYGSPRSVNVAIDCNSGRFGPYFDDLNAVPWDDIPPENLSELCPS